MLLSIASKVLCKNYLNKNAGQDSTGNAHLQPNKNADDYCGVVSLVEHD